MLYLQKHICTLEWESLICGYINKSLVCLKSNPMSPKIFVKLRTTQYQMCKAGLKMKIAYGRNVEQWAHAEWLRPLRRNTECRRAYSEQNQYSKRWWMDVFSVVTSIHSAEDNCVLDFLYLWYIFVFYFYKITVGYH